MKLSRVAKRFNDTPCTDSYTGDFVFKAQLGVFTEAVRDGITTQRRVLEVAPEETVPDRRVINFGGINWIMGGPNIDMWRGKIIRIKYPVHEAKGLANIQTPLERLNGTDGTLAYAGIVFVKTNKEVEISSHEFNQSTMYLSMSEKVVRQQLITLDGFTFIVKGAYPATAGHLGVIVEQLDYSDVVKAQTEGERNPVTEKYEPGPEIDVIRLRWQTDFQYYSQMTEKFMQGDMQVVTQQTNDIKVGAKLTIEGQVWDVVGDEVKMDEGITYLHLRRGR